MKNCPPCSVLTFVVHVGFILLFFFCRVLCCGYSSKNQVKKMEAGHHDLSKVTVVGDPQLLQRRIDAVRLAGPTKLQVFLFFYYHNFWALYIDF